MATAVDIVTRARQRLRIHADEEPLEAHELEKGFYALNDMLYAWVQDGTIKAFKTGRANDVVHVITQNGRTLTNEAALALITNLAVILAGDYGVDVPPQVVAVAKSTFDAIEAMRDVPMSTVDPALSYMPSQRFYDGYILGDE